MSSHPLAHSASFDAFQPSHASTLDGNPSSQDLPDVWEAVDLFHSRDTKLNAIRQLTESIHIFIEEKLLRSGELDIHANFEELRSRSSFLIEKIEELNEFGTPHTPMGPGQGQQTAGGSAPSYNGNPNGYTQSPHLNNGYNQYNHTTPQYANSTGTSGQYIATTPNTYVPTTPTTPNGYPPNLNGYIYPTNAPGYPMRGQANQFGRSPTIFGPSGSPAPMNHQPYHGNHNINTGPSQYPYNPSAPPPDQGTGQYGDNAWGPTQGANITQQPRKKQKITE